MEILKFYLEKQFLIKYYVIKHLRLLKEFVFYCVIDIFSRYTWVSPLNDKKSITNAFQKILV